MTSINFRPHHFLCTLCFQGKGYSPKFVDNYQNIFDELHADNGENTPIKVVSHTDSICSPCPHKRELNCTSQEKIAQLDHEHAKVLNLNAGDTLTWKEAKQSIKEKMTLAHFHKICEPCNWKKLGICEQTLQNFLEE